MRKQKKQNDRKSKKGKMENKKWQLEAECIYRKNGFAWNADFEYKRMEIIMSAIRNAGWFYEKGRINKNFYSFYRLVEKK